LEILLLFVAIVVAIFVYPTMIGTKIKTYRILVLIVVDKDQDEDRDEDIGLLTHKVEIDITEQPLSPPLQTQKALQKEIEKSP